MAKAAPWALNMIVDPIGTMYVGIVVAALTKNQRENSYAESSMAVGSSSTVLMSANETKWTQQYASFYLSDNKSLPQLSREIIAAGGFREGADPLRVLLKDGSYYSYDNRRLTAAKMASYMSGEDIKVPVKIYTDPNHEDLAKVADHFSPETNGESVELVLNKQPIGVTVNMDGGIAAAEDVTYASESFGDKAAALIGQLAEWIGGGG